MSFKQEKRMTQADRVRQAVSTVVVFITLAETKIRYAFTLTALLFVTLTCFAQERTTTTPQSNAETGTTISIPAGTKLSLVLTHSVLSRSTHRGDDVYAQTIFPVTLNNDVVIPSGTFVQGKVDKLVRDGSRGELHLQSMSVIFPDGYTAPVPGPMNLESDEGYILLDPGKGRFAGAIAAPIIGLGAGLLIGRAVSNSPGTTINGMNFNMDKAESTGIGGLIGAATGGIVSLVILTRSHQFFLDVGTPVDMTLQQPLVLEAGPVNDAVRQSTDRPASIQPVEPRPRPYRRDGRCY
jgi:hypothetical protein